MISIIHALPDSTTLRLDHLLYVTKVHNSAQGLRASKDQPNFKIVLIDRENSLKVSCGEDLEALEEARADLIAAWELWMLKVQVFPK